MRGVFKRGKIWYIYYCHQGKRYREAIGSNKNLAISILQKRKVEIAENKHLDIRRMEEIKLSDFSKEYLEVYAKPNKRSWKKSDVIHIKQLCSIFVDMYMHEITPIMIEKYKISRSKEVSQATVNRELATLKRIYSIGNEWGKIDYNPVKKVKSFREKNKRVRYLEKHEVNKLIESAAPHLKPILVTAVNTGMRRGEILGLKWRDIDFKNRIIYVLDTKNGEGREVPMNQIVYNAIIRVQKHPDSEYIFHKQDGRPIESVQTSFLTATRKAGIVNFRFHDLRHTFASHLVMSGVELNTVRELLGHKSLAMTLRYAHLSPKHKRRAVELLERYNAPATPQAIEVKNVENISSLQTIVI